MEVTADRGRYNIVTADDCVTSERSNARDLSGNDEGMEESLRKLLHLYPVVGTHLDAKEEDMARRQTYLCGLVLVAVGGLSFIVSIYAIVLSKLMPPTGYWLLDAIREDYHFCYLVPLTIYPSCAAVYLSWVSLKFFRHN